jgi:hypothetical protein
MKFMWAQDLYDKFARGEAIPTWAIRSTSRSGKTTQRRFRLWEPDGPNALWTIQKEKAQNAARHLIAASKTDDLLDVIDSEPYQRNVKGEK